MGTPGALLCGCCQACEEQSNQDFHGPSSISILQVFEWFEGYPEAIQTGVSTATSYQLSTACCWGAMAEEVCQNPCWELEVFPAVSYLPKHGCELFGSRPKLTVSSSLILQRSVFQCPGIIHLLMFMYL